MVVEQNVQSLRRETIPDQGMAQDLQMPVCLDGRPVFTQHLVQGIFPINLLQLRAIRLALMHFTIQIIGLHIPIWTDNIFSKTYINKRGFNSLHKEGYKILIWARKHLVSIKVEHV